MIFNFNNYQVKLVFDVRNENVFRVGEEVLIFGKENENGFEILLKSMFLF